MKMLYLVICAIPILLISPLKAEEEIGNPQKVIEESDVVSYDEVISSKATEENVDIDTTDPIVRLRMDEEQKIILIITQIEELEDRSKEPELQKEIERIKIETEIKILEIQLENAIKKGYQELAEELKIALDNLLHPEKFWPDNEIKEREIDASFQNDEQILYNNLPSIDEPRELEKELSKKTKKVVPEVENEEEEDEKEESDK
ncbi:hypothetical protein KAX02_13205 [candidate division WOR-3 bacterium]|nr:hypothetical protein [candidate division WOR-3 bacterium]